MSRAIRSSLLATLTFGVVVPVGAQSGQGQAFGPRDDAPAGTRTGTASGPMIGSSTRASLTGAWTVTITTEQGEFDTRWELEQHDDGTVTGTIEGRRGSAEAEGGWVKGDAFGFAVTREFQGQSFKIGYEGTFDEQSLAGTLTAGEGRFTAEFTGVRAEGEDR